VIGVDERVRVRDTTADPWRKICCLTITGANGAVARGTAWFVGPRTLLTAGHCVYSTVLFGGWAQEIYVEPARDGAEVPFGTLKSTWFSTLRAWIDDETPDMDVGCIQLDEPHGERLGWFEIDTGWDDVAEPDTVTIAGYPVDRDSGNAMYLHRSSLLRSTATQLFYDVDTVGGQSGAPVWMDAADGSSKAIGIHAYGASGELDPVLGVEANYGRRFTSELMVTIASWVSENA
jgi:V8-like Glu-specific endopeptidase